MTTKEIAILFLKMASSGQIEDAYDQFISKDFKHHNQYFNGDRNSLMQGMITAHKSNPNKNIEIKKVYSDGNTVLTHSLVQRATPNNFDIAVIHIFRFENNKIVEMWDLGQTIDPNSPNMNGLF